QLAICMRSSGLPIEVMIEYVNLFQQGDQTIPARLELLKNQMDVLKSQKKHIEETMERLSYKISIYEKALETGKLTWNKEGENEK
ncbi:MAG: MerR family transcriptional regulator, partial [Clostridia bacterium]|nr:MerR family transcriptional regulator [Clostridia bacterium]